MISQRKKLSVLRAARQRGGIGSAAKAARLVDDESSEVRLRAFEVLDEHGDRRWARLASGGLEDPVDTVVVTALQCLVDWEVRRSVAKVTSLLESSSQLTRTYAAWAIGKLGTKRHVPLLRARLRRLDDEVEVSALSEALFVLTGERRYLRRLLGQLDSTDPEARAFTTNSLVGVVDQKNFPLVISALATALKKEKSAGVLPSLRRDLQEVVALAVEWSENARAPTT